MFSVKILGTGGYAPDFIASNEDFAGFVDTSDEWITTRTGMKKRHISQGEPGWHMGLQAAQKAMEAARADPGEIGLVLATTCTPDFYTPSLSAILQRALGIVNAFAFDVNVACAGFSFAVDCARNYLAMGTVKKVLLVAAETLSQFVDYTDRAMCVLFGDGAGAAVIEGAEGVYGSFQYNDIAGTEFIYGKRSRRDTPFQPENREEIPEPFPVSTVDNFTMNGREVYKFATKAMPAAIEEACRRAGISVPELDMIFPHQANLRILQTAAKNMGVSMERVYVNIQEYGNTSSASIPLSLDECARSGRIKRGDKICLVGFGAGLCSGATVFAY